jgi:hypothetical protein
MQSMRATLFPRFLQLASSPSIHSIFVAALTAAMMFSTMLCPLVAAQVAGQGAAASHTLLTQSLITQPLITQPIDESRLTTLKGNTHPLARPVFDLGTAPATLPMARMLLVLKRSPEQEAALRKLLDDQQDKASPSYHKWLTPEQFGKQFGPTDSDMQTITAWLESHGFQVGTSKGRTVLEFSGSASQVQEAFHTAIHKYIVNGEQHWANASDPQIPTALTPAVAGVLTLHNFLKQPTIHWSKEPVAAKLLPGKKKPQVTFSNGDHGLGPGDFATIYNSPGLFEYSGTPATIGIVGRSNLFGDQTGAPGGDVTSFRNVFSLPGSGPNIILNGPDPGDLGGGEEAEATLDSTWSGAVSPYANIDLVVSATTNTTDGIDLSEVYIIENNLADVMTESFSGCEAYASSAEAAGYSYLAEQAAAQGITYFVSTGDTGAEGCDNQSETVATGPISVNVIASTAFNVAVGGNVFSENGDTSLYWNTTNGSNQDSAISYIPEDVWNDSCASPCTNPNIEAGAGGASIDVPKPSWQSGVTGIPNDGARDLPDVALSAASHDPYLLCLEASCVPNSQGEFYIYFVWGTSASAPSFAGIMSLIDQQMFNSGGVLRQGAANYVLYKLAATENSTLSQCNASSTSGLPASTCIFNDVTVGNNAVPGELDYGSSTADYQAGVGYDQATGLGSVNVTNLINQWNSVTFNPTTTALTLNNGTAVTIVHGQSVPVKVVVSPSSGTGTPTGDVVLFTGNGLSPSTMNLFGLTGGQAISSTNTLPGGTNYNVWSHYGGDSTYASSNSNQVSVTVTQENSTTTETILAFDQSGNSIPLTNIPYGSFVYLRADVVGDSGYGFPTGNVTFTDSFGPIPGGGVFALNGGDNGATHLGSNTADPQGIAFDAGSHTISAAYGGDSSFNPSSTTQSQTFTITPGFLATVASNQSTVIISAQGGTGSSSMTVANSTGFSGTINFACSGLPSEASCSFSPSSITANGSPNTATVTIAVTTTAPTTLLRQRRPYFVASWFVGSWMAGLGLLLPAILISEKQRRVRGLFLPLMLALVALLIIAPSCGGGGGGNSGPPPNPGTPTGTSIVTVTATSGSTASATGFTLVVQ